MYCTVPPGVADCLYYLRPQTTCSDLSTPTTCVQCTCTFTKGTYNSTIAILKITILLRLEVMDPFNKSTVKTFPISNFNKQNYKLSTLRVELFPLPPPLRILLLLLLGTTLSSSVPSNNLLIRSRHCFTTISN